MESIIAPTKSYCQKLAQKTRQDQGATSSPLGQHDLFALTCARLAQHAEKLDALLDRIASDSTPTVADSLAKLPPALERLVAWLERAQSLPTRLHILLYDRLAAEYILASKSLADVLSSLPQAPHADVEELKKATVIASDEHAPLLEAMKKFQDSYEHMRQHGKVTAHGVRTLLAELLPETLKCGSDEVAILEAYVDELRKDNKLEDEAALYDRIIAAIQYTEEAVVGGEVVKESEAKESGPVEAEQERRFILVNSEQQQQQQEDKKKEEEASKPKPRTPKLPHRGPQSIKEQCEDLVKTIAEGTNDESRFDAFQKLLNQLPYGVETYSALASVPSVLNVMQKCLDEHRHVLSVRSALTALQGMAYFVPSMQTKIAESSDLMRAVTKAMQVPFAADRGYQLIATLVQEGDARAWAAVERTPGLIERIVENSIAPPSPQAGLGGLEQGFVVLRLSGNKTSPVNAGTDDRYREHACEAIVLLAARAPNGAWLQRHPSVTPAAAQWAQSANRKIREYGMALLHMARR